MARQVKRKSHSKSHHTSSSSNHSNNDDSEHKRPKLKHGRNEVRNVTRTARRGYGYNEDNEQNENEEGKEVEEEEESEEEAGNDEDFDEDRGKAYDALLTLLKSDHKEPKISKSKKFDKDITDDVNDDELEDEDEDEDENEIVGVNIDENDVDEEDDDEVDSDDEEEVTSGLASDPFEVHFNQVTESYMESQEKIIIKEKQKWIIDGKDKYDNYSSITQIPPGKPITLINEKKSFNDINELSIKKRLIDAFDYKENLSDLDEILLSNMINYKDINFPYQSFKNTSYRKLYTLHALNHIFKTRDRIIKNTTKLHTYREAIKNGEKSNDDNEEPEFRDQGFTRPKVLILLPTRQACHEIVEMLIKYSGSEQQENKKKFTGQFHSKDQPPSSKPADFIDTFKGNNNDFFCMGLKFTRKTIKLYSSFYSSDIILASPIGLSMILENDDKKKRQYDFISSIEVLIVDKANQIEMQNWDHITTILKYLNKIPKDFHDADFSRIRMWSINDQSKLLRQNLIFSEYLTPNINNLTTTKSLNLSGKLKFKPIISQQNCIMNSIGIKIKQIFQRFESSNPMEDPDARFKFFINSVLPSLIKSSSYSDGILIYIPSYFDYIRIKNHMKSNTKFLFDGIDEYTAQSKLTKIRQNFQSGKIKILLYTERLHYFRRYELNGVKTILIYQLPSNPVFYKELVKFLAKSIFKEVCDLNLVFVKTMFSKWDGQLLERVIGNDRAPVLANSPNEMYEFR
ncbi:U3 snoRNA-associated protein 25 [Scheffersomyces coipomensis]|uniref:U3 snoRNA-associated protein 25 n=1 Tax=Scheffersomyces coipomensis TaxID=1788519 RepID=UPI00315D3547